MHRAFIDPISKFCKTYIGNLLKFHRNSIDSYRTTTDSMNVYRLNPRSLELSRRESQHEISWTIAAEMTGWVDDRTHVHLSSFLPMKIDEESA